MLLLTFITIQAQIVNPKKVRFGKISEAEMELSSYAQYPDAAAVVIFDEGDLHMDLDDNYNTFEYLLESHIRIKILKASATDLANFSFLLEKSEVSYSKEEIIAVKGITYNMVNGQLEETKLTKEGIFEEKITDGLSRLTIALPQVKEGSIIELKYTKKSDFLFNLPTWNFQREIPTDYSSFEADIPEYFSYNLDMLGYASHTLTESIVGQTGTGYVTIQVSENNRKNGNSFYLSSANRSRVNKKIDFFTRNYRWVAQQVPALHKEPFAPNPRNFFFRISFELASTDIPGQTNHSYTRSWEDVSDTYRGGAGTRPYREPKNDIQELSQNWIAEASDEQQKVLNIYEGVKQKFTWNEFFSKYVKESPGRLIKLASGNSAELNYMLLGALRAQGISADPVLISTPNHGYLSMTRPSLTQFNHVIVLVKFQDSGQTLLLDATSDAIPAGLLPEYDFVQKGRLMTEIGSEWIEIVPPAYEKTATRLNLSLTKDGNLSGEGSFKISDYAARDLRQELDNEADMSTHLQDWLGLSVTEVETSGFDDPYTAVNVSADIDATNHLIQQDDYYYLPTVLAKQFAKNPLKTENRTLPVDWITPREDIYMVQISIDEGLQVEELPKNISLALLDDKARYSLRFTEMNGSIQIIEKLSIKETFYSAEEYGALKTFIDMVIENQQASLVIKGE